MPKSRFGFWETVKRFAKGASITDKHFGVGMAYETRPLHLPVRQRKAARILMAHRSKPAEKIAAIKKLVALEADNAVSFIQDRAENDANTGVRREAIRALGKLTFTTPSSRAIIRLAREEPNPNVRWTAMDVCADRLPSYAIKLLEDLLEQEVLGGSEEQDQRRAIETLGEIGVRKDVLNEAADAITLIEKTAEKNANRIVRGKAVHTLGKVKSGKSIPLIERIVGNTNEDNYVRTLGVHALVEMDSRGSVELLRRISEEPGMREDADQAIKELTRLARKAQ